AGGWTTSRYSCGARSVRRARGRCGARIIRLDYANAVAVFQEAGAALDHVIGPLQAREHFDTAVAHRAGLDAPALDALLLVHDEHIAVAVSQNDARERQRGG